MARKKEYIFRLRQFSVIHRLSAMKVGIDAMLLGAWVDVTGDTLLLDAGCGCGIISLMLAQRSGDDSAIQAIDTSAMAIIEAKQNFESSPWGTRLSAHRADFSALQGEYTHIISNPPYFDSGADASQSQRLSARHAAVLSPVSLLWHGSKIIVPGGRISMICPPFWLEELEDVAKAQSLRLERICRVSPHAGEAANRLLLTFIKNKISGSKVLNEKLFIRTESGEYSRQYRELTADFHLW